MMRNFDSFPQTEVVKLITDEDVNQTLTGE